MPSARACTREIKKRQARLRLGNRAHRRGFVFLSLRLQKFLQLFSVVVFDPRTEYWQCLVEEDIPVDHSAQRHIEKKDNGTMSIS